MRILVFDYSGHPFQVQLSRELARRGHEVVHSYSAGFQTPKGNLVLDAKDPLGFRIEPVRNRAAFAKNSFFRRRQQEIEIGHELAKLCDNFAPDVVISSNAPLDTQRIISSEVRQRGIRFVFWLQDIYSRAISAVVPRKFPIVGSAIAAWYRHLEFRMLRQADHVVAITEDFAPILATNGIGRERISVIENWAPLEELPRLPRNNDWSCANMAADAVRVVYSGTLGYKHNPRLLLDLARELPGTHVHVFSEGEVADRLASDAVDQRVSNLSVQPWVPFADLPAMLSGADVFVAVIEPGAGIYSVPSKVLTYLGIGRPILASVPLENLASRLVRQNEAGFVAPPGREQELIARARELAADASLRKRLGDNGRAYAHRAFAIEAIADNFVAIIGDLCKSRASGS